MSQSTCTNSNQLIWFMKNAAPPRPGARTTAPRHAGRGAHGRTNITCSIKFGGPPYVKDPPVIREEADAFKKVSHVRRHALASNLVDTPGR